MQRLQHKTIAAQHHGLIGFFYFNPVDKGFQLLRLLPEPAG